MTSLESTTWVGDWAWGVPLVVGSLLMHVVGLNLIGVFVLGEYTRILRRSNAFVEFIGIVGVTALLTISLHALESGIWGGAYVLLGALSNTRTAMLYSLGAMTTYGNTRVSLAPHWQLLGAMEALQGMLLFGLTTAFLFSIFRQVTPFKRSEIGKRISTRAKLNGESVE